MWLHGIAYEQIIFHLYTYNFYINTLMDTRISEIQNFLSHKDYSLATRRMLDLSLDSGSPDLLRNAISWSQKYRSGIEKGSEPAAGFLQEAKDLLESSKKNENNTHNQRLLLNAEHISKTYSTGNFSLKPISLKIHSGDVLGVVGQNGHGKTTLLRCLAGQLALDNGELKYDGLNHPDYYSIKQHVSFIPQRIPRWYGHLKDNLHFATSIAGVKGETNRLMVDFMLERLNLSAFAHLTWDQISSGYRTRFEIARVLLQKPKLLILDEPLANLDINAQQTILTDLRYMAKSAHNPMGIVLSSQQLHEVEKIADTVLMIKDGECLFRTGETPVAEKVFVVEVETIADRDELVAALDNEEIQVQYNGGFYTLTSASVSAQEIINRLASKQIPVTYFRDITHSTKRFF
ncbi:MAG TPA: ABC transporter ATP-binding protein [Parasegetibacter sp.]